MYRQFNHELNNFMLFTYFLLQFLIYFKAFNFKKLNSYFSQRHL